MANDEEFFGGTVERSVDGATYAPVALVRGVKVPEISVEMQKNHDGGQRDPRSHISSKIWRCGRVFDHM